MKVVKSELEVLHVPVAICLPFQSFNFIVDALCLSVTDSMSKVAQ